MNHWFPLIRPAINPLFLGGVALGGQLGFPEKSVGWNPLRETTPERHVAFFRFSLPGINNVYENRWAGFNQSYPEFLDAMKSREKIWGYSSMGEAVSVQGGDVFFFDFLDMGVYKNNGTPKSSILKGFSPLFSPSKFWG